MPGLDGLINTMKKKGRAAVAFSGGVDSSLVALAAMKAFEGDTIGIMVFNDTIPSSDINSAEIVASEIGLDLMIIEVDVLENEEFTENDPDRCAICRKMIMPEVIKEAERRGFDQVFDGANRDDLMDHRPGHAVSSSLGIIHPLIETDLGKEEIRAILKAEGLDVHRRPSSPCLATRIPYGQSVTIEKLKLIDHLEEKVKTLGFVDVRVRLHENNYGTFTAILEVDDPEKAIKVWDKILLLSGKLPISLDPKGYRQGSMNEVLLP